MPCGVPVFEPGLIQRLSEQYPSVNVPHLARSIGPSARNPNAVLVVAVRRAQADLDASPISPEEAAHIKDREIFEAAWPTASRYYTPEERAAFAAAIPGWNPACDVNALIAAAAADRHARDIAEGKTVDRAAVARMISDRIRRIAAEKSSAKAHGPDCTCETCFFPSHERFLLEQTKAL